MENRYYVCVYKKDNNCDFSMLFHGFNSKKPIFKFFNSTSYIFNFAIVDNFKHLVEFYEWDTWVGKYKLAHTSNI